MKITKEKSILIHHLNYTVEVKDISKAKGFIKEFLENYLACTEEVDRHKSIVWIKFPIVETEIPTLLHELLHVMQNICKWHNIDFEKEQEHIPYIYHYIMNQIFGFKYED